MRGQVSIEFVLVMGIAVMFLLVMLVIAASQLENSVDESNQQAIVDIGNVLQQELITASTVHNGYIRNFTIPQTLTKRGYTIVLQNDSNQSAIVLYGAKSSYTVMTPRCTGTLRPGSNVIRRQNDTIWCNQ